MNTLIQNCVCNVWLEFLQVLITIVIWQFVIDKVIDDPEYSVVPNTSFNYSIFSFYTQRSSWSTVDFDCFKCSLS